MHYKHERQMRSVKHDSMHAVSFKARFQSSVPSDMHTDIDKVSSLQKSLKLQHSVFQFSNGIN